MSGIRVGTSGWKYPRWRGDFYPDGLRQADELSYLAERLNTVEINSTFYALQHPGRFAAWRDATRDDFVFAVKGSRYITHMKRLADPKPGLSRFASSGPFELGDKLGPFLWQLPANVQFDPVVLRRFLIALPAGRHAIEARHASFRRDRCTAMLREHNVALVCADTGGRFPYCDQPTADFMYVRLHGPAELYCGSYSQDELAQWARRVLAWQHDGLDVYVYFDNDADGAAPWNALALAGMVGLRRSTRMADTA